MDENKKVCETCKYFQQHFSWTGRKFQVVYCGYCRPPHSQPRRPRPDHPACRFYEKNECLPKRLWSKEDPLTVYFGK